MRNSGTLLLLCWGAFALTARAATHALTCDTADYVIGEGPPPFVTVASGNTFRIGANNNSTPGGRNAVLIFQLPFLPSIESIATAELRFTVSGLPGSPSFNGDLWGIGFQTDTSPRLEYFEADTGDAGNTKLADNVLTPATVTGLVSCSTVALADYVRGFYADHPGYFGGTYVFLRLNPDADAGTNSVGWGIYAADTITNAATLTLVTTNATGITNAGYTNIVVLISDDQRWDALGVVQREMGAAGRFPWFSNGTPNLDRLAAEGIRFRNARVTLSLCSPSRAAIQTGCYNHRNTIINNGTPFPTSSVTFATQLRQAGYVTAWIGKWHMGGQVERPGYDFAASFLGQGTYFDATFYVNGVPTPSTGWVDDVSTDYALSFIQTNLNRPFALVVGFKTPHGPRDPPPRTAALYSNDYCLDVPNSGRLPAWDTAASKPATNSLDDYFRCITAMDEDVGRILDALDSFGLTTNTLVIYCSDNGYYFGEHGQGDKRSAYEESMRIPLLVRYPKLIPQATVRDELVLNIDFAPTILDIARVAIPAGMQGVSWRALFAGVTNGWRQTFLYEYFLEPNYVPPTMFAVRTPEAKLILYPGQPAWSELYQLSADPYETSNLFNVAASAPVRDSLFVEFNRLLTQTGLGATLSAPTLSATNRKLIVTGGMGPRYEIESAPGLPAVWSPLTQVKMDSPSKTVTDPNAAPSKFYRARMITD